MKDILPVADLLRPDDTLRFKLYAQQTIIQETARLTIEVNALVNTAEQTPGALLQRIRSALTHLVEAEWAFSAIQRGGEAVGYERVQLTASARVPITEIYNLEERARQASCEGLSLREPSVSYVLPSDRVTAAVQALRLEILEDVKKQIAEFNRATGRTWRIGDIAFGVRDPRSESRTGKGAYRSCDDSIADLFEEAGDEGITGSERISLVADVTLRALPNQDNGAEHTNGDAFAPSV